MTSVSANPTPSDARVAYLSSRETAASISAKYAQALLEAGATVDLFHTERSRGREFDEALVPTSAERHLLPWGRRHGLTPRYYLSRLRLLRADIIVAEDPDLLAFAQGYARRSRARLVYVPFEYYPGASYATPEMAQRWADIERDLAPFVSSWVMLGDKIAERYANVLAPSAAVHVVYNSLPRDLGPAAPVLRRALEVGPEVKLVLYQGSVREKRGVWDAVEAMPLLPSDVHLVVLGMGELDRLRSDVAARGLTGRVHVLDAVPHNELLDYTRGADVGLIPIRNTCVSYDLCSPAKLFEFIAAGLPLAVSRLSQLEWFVERHGLGEVFDLESPPALARAVQRLLSERDVYDACRRRIIELHQREVCWEVQREKLQRAVLMPAVGAART